MKTRRYLLLPIRILIFFSIFVAGSICTGKQLPEISNWWSIAASIVNIAVIVILVAVGKKEKQTYAQMINYKKGRTSIISVIGVTTVIIVFGIGGMYLSGFICYGQFPYAAAMMIAPVPLWLAIANCFILPVSTTFAEDGLYLGCGVNAIKSKWAAILIPGVFYALQHSFIPTLFDWKYMLYRFLSFLPLTILMCCWYYRKRNPVPFMIGHAVIDIGTVVQILLTSANPGLYILMLHK